MIAFVAGFGQFFIPTHLLAVIALGLMAGQNAKQMLYLGLAAFALGLLAGSMLIASATRETQAALVLLFLAAISGLIVVAALPVPALVKNALALATGVALALNSPPQAIAVPAAISIQTGTAVAALLAVAIVTFITAKAAFPWQRIGIRIVGSWVAASAILVLALKLAR
jgi:urease accessory protein